MRTKIRVNWRNKKETDTWAKIIKQNLVTNKKQVLVSSGASSQNTGFIKSFLKTFDMTHLRACMFLKEMYT